MVSNQAVLRADDSILDSFEAVIDDPLSLPITNREGRTLEAKIIAIGEDTVTFRSISNGREYTVPFGKLSAECVEQIAALKRSGVFQPYKWPGFKSWGRTWTSRSKKSSLLSTLYLLFLRNEEVSSRYMSKYSSYLERSTHFDEFNAIESPTNFIQLSFANALNDYPIAFGRGSSQIELIKSSHKRFLNYSSNRINPFKRKSADNEPTEQEGFIQRMTFSPIKTEALNGSVRNFISVHLATIKEPNLVSTRPDYLIIKLNKDSLTLLNLNTLQQENLQHYPANQLTSGFSIQLRIPRHEAEQLNQLVDATFLKIKHSDHIGITTDFAVAYFYKIGHE